MSTSSEESNDKLENRVHNMWSDKNYQKLIDSYGALRERIIKKRGLTQGSDDKIGDDDRLDVDLAPHIRNWFENPAYQKLIKPSMRQTKISFVLAAVLTVVVFGIGAYLLWRGLSFVGDPTTNNDTNSAVTIATLILSGTATIITSLFRAIALLKDVAIQYAKLQIAISAGLVSIDALQRIVGHQEKLNEEEYKSIQEITKALAPLIKAFEKSSKEE